MNAKELGFSHEQIMDFEVGEIYDFIIAKNNLIYHSQLVAQQRIKEKEEEDFYGRWATQDDFDRLRSL